MVAESSRSRESTTRVSRSLQAGQRTTLAQDLQRTTRDGGFAHSLAPDRRCPPGGLAEQQTCRGPRDGVIAPREERCDATKGSSRGSACPGDHSRGWGQAVTSGEDWYWVPLRADGRLSGLWRRPIAGAQPSGSSSMTGPGAPTSTSLWTAAAWAVSTYVDSGYDYCVVDLASGEVSEILDTGHSEALGFLADGSQQVIVDGESTHATIVPDSANEPVLIRDSHEVEDYRLCAQAAGDAMERSCTAGRTLLRPTRADHPSGRRNRGGGAGLAAGPSSRDGLHRARPRSTSPSTARDCWSAWRTAPSSSCRSYRPSRQDEEELARVRLTGSWTVVARDRDREGAYGGLSDVRSRDGPPQAVAATATWRGCPPTARRLGPRRPRASRTRPTHPACLPAGWSRRSV